MAASLLPRLPSVKDLVKIYNLSAKAQLSQNFLLDKNITDKIIRLAKLNWENSLAVEVGPGPGLLTRSLLEAGAPNLVVVEKDERFLPSLSQLSEAVDSNMKIIHGDMLKIDSQTIFEIMKINQAEVESVHIIGNLPFAVATPLLMQWLYMCYGESGLLHKKTSSMTLMFQKEVAERIVAAPGSKIRGRLSVMAQAVCNAKFLYKVPSSSFVPAPKVDAGVIQLTPRSELTIKAPFKVFEEVVRTFYVKRRKTLRRIANDHSPELLHIVTDLGFDLTNRPEDLTTDQFCQLANTIFTHHPEILKQSLPTPTHPLLLPQNQNPLP